MVNSGKINKRAGYALHVMTASGAAAGLLALQAVIDNNIRGALIWLVVCQVLDGLDGPIARKIDVVFHAPRIDGFILDLIVDYLTCVVVPVALLVRLQLLPDHFQTIIAGIILLISALWFARTDIETEDHWFNGFPAVWNLAVPTYLVLDLSKNSIAVISLLLCFTQLTTIKFPHIIRVESLRMITLPFGILYIGNLFYLSWSYSNTTGIHHQFGSELLMSIFPIYIIGISLWRSLRTGADDPNTVID
jgi:phosphatidylcholine synthase